MDSPVRIMKKSAVLVPYDFGPRSVAALKEAITITKYVKGEIHIISVIHKGDFFSQLFRSEKDNRRIQREAQEKLRDIAAKIKQEEGVKAHIIVEQGNPIEVILEQASLINAQYIVMGNIGESNLDFNIFGASTMQIIGEAPCPVLTVSSNTIAEGFSNIVLPIDLTEQTIEKVTMALSWAKYYKANIHLVGVLTGCIEFSKSRLNMKLSKAKFIIESEGVKCTAELYEKSDTPISQRILQHAKKVNGDLLMIMTHKELRVVDNYVGSVAQKLLKGSDIPVISFTSRAIEHKAYFVSSFLPFDILETKDLQYLRG